MRFDHDGLSLWFGSPHTSAPEGAIAGSSPAAVLVGVQPAHSGNRVEIRYRVDGGSIKILLARPLQTPFDSDEQYFVAEFPSFYPGARVDYTAIFRYAERQVPSPADADHLTASFRIAANNERLVRSGAIGRARSARVRRRFQISAIFARANAAGVRSGSPKTGQLKRTGRDGSVPTPALDGPEFSVHITSAPATVHSNVQFTVQGVTEKTGGAITAVDVQFGAGSAFKRASNTQGNWATWSIKGMLTSPGEAIITARAQMGVNFRHVTRTVLVDDTPPTLQITAPPPDAIIEGRGPSYAVLVEGNASDAMSGVKSVVVQLDNGQTFPVSGVTNWNSLVFLPGEGTKSIIAVATDFVGNERTMTLHVTAMDSAAPDLAITDPKPLPATVTQPAIRVIGSALDGTGVDSVKWQLNDGEVTLATNLSSDWSTWEVAIPLPRAGQHTLRFFAQDAAIAHNVTAPLEWNFEVPSLSKLEGTSLSAYLHDLLGYIKVRVVDRAASSEEEAKVDEAKLEQAFFQPFARIDEAAGGGAAFRPVAQVRICVEVLRRLFEGAPAEGESRYREAVYTALLRGLGASYEEIRLARGADEDTRKALAARLGIALTLPRPDDELDQLFLTPERLTHADSESDLELLFGLGDTRRDPLQDSPQAKLHVWQNQRLRSQWAEQDTTSDSDADAAVPIIEPDLIAPSDIKDGGDGTPVLTLWQERTDWVLQALAELRGLPDAPTALQTFDEVVASVLGPIDLEKMAADYNDGTDINGELEASELSLAAFLHLVRIRRLAATAAVLETEWEDVFSILVQVRKQRDQYVLWRQQEQMLGLTLGPDYFRVATDEDGLPAPPIALRRWLASTQARRRWERTLTARIEQNRAVRESLAAAVASAEREALPLLRELLIGKIQPPESGIDVADWLTTRLQIDVRLSGFQLTTRLHQAAETLQGMLFALRTDRFDTLEPLLGPLPFTAWDLSSEAAFDEEWRWMGAYESWRAAILVFGYPENYLLPTLRKAEKQTDAFRNLTDQLRRRVQLTPKDARDLATGYMHHTSTSEPPADPPFVQLEALLEGDPSLSAADFIPTDQRSEQQLAKLRHDSAALFAKFTDPLHPPEFVAEIGYFVPVLLALQLQKSGQYLAALQWYQHVYSYNLSFDERKIYRGLVVEEDVAEDFERLEQWLLGDGLNPHEIVSRLSPRASVYTRFTIMSLVRCFLEFGDAEFTQATAEAIPRARSLYIAALDLLRDIEPVPAGDDEVQPFPPNTMPASVRLHAETNLAKLRNGLNIAGLELASLLERGVTHLPTPYRFTTLMARAKDLTAVAQQMEAAYLAALERRDAEAYSLLQARQHIELANATVTLQNRRVDEASQSSVLAALQRQRSLIQADHFNTLLAEGFNKAEKDLLFGLATVGALSYGVDALFGDSIFGSIPGNLVSFGASLIPNFIGNAFSTSQSAKFQYLQLSSSFERREQEWTLQRDLAEHDVNVGLQQMVAAHLHTRVALQERAIAIIQSQQAQATTEFLATKFTNLDLYDFMSGVLGGIYGYFLQRASATAALAENQLAFERQERSQSFIQADYWQPASESQTASAGSGAQGNRGGLTGSARLLQDIFRLDQHAFETRKRLLQLSQTFSLASIAPFELQRFRETGLLQFSTPMELFDRGFPGHYLRLIRRVRVSIIALVPPAHGIRATLTGSGLSRVVVAGGTFGDTFETTVVRRPPEQIAFTGPIEATGLLELEADTDLLRPFEGMGVDTTWELSLPRAANPLDYGSIADVLVTIEYTALHSPTYQEQVMRQLPPFISADRSFSFRNDFPDSFYELSNPGDDRPVIGLFRTRSADFPANVDDTSIQHLLMYFVLQAGIVTGEVEPLPQIEVANLLFTPDRLQPADEDITVGGAAVSTPDGIISTRRGNGRAWDGIRGLTPAGRWELELADAMRPRLERGEIADIILVITYSGRTPV